VKAIINTDVLHDYLHGMIRARDELSLYTEAAISLVSWMEVLTQAQDGDQERDLRERLERFHVLPVTDDVAARAVHLRRGCTVAWSDSIVWATAQVNKYLLVTRNAHVLPPGDPGVRVPYRV